MKTSWFYEIVKNWNEKLQWNNNELGQITRILKEISSLNGGRIAWDIDQDESIERFYAIMKLEYGLQKWVNSLVKDIRPKFFHNVYKKPSTTFHLDNNESVFFQASETLPKLNINEMTSSQLESLPGLGRITAARIIAYREQKGNIESFDELKNIRGIGNRQIAQFENMIEVSKSVAGVQFFSNEMESFYRNPSFESYIKFLLRGGIVGKGNVSIDPENIKIEISKTLSQIIVWFKEKPDSERRGLKTLGSAATERFHRIKAAESFAESKEMSAAHGTLVFDSRYAQFLKTLFDVAKEKIRVAMFYIRIGTDDKYPTRIILDSMISANKRGVDVKVILDKDKEGQVFGSRIINEEACNFFKKANIAVKFQERDRLMHAKVVTVDGKHTIVGSHNWTAGSIYQYQDTSIHIRSEELALHYDQWFDKLWKET